MSQARCPDCGYSRPTGTPDAAAFHKPGCKTRRALQREERKPQGMTEDRGLPKQTIAGATCQVVGGLIVAAILPSDPPQRWMAQA